MIDVTRKGPGAKSSSSNCFMLSTADWGMILCGGALAIA